jgi:FKBP-type peptidyl-prolyl cis-trans isomerase SlyD
MISGKVQKCFKKFGGFVEIKKNSFVSLNYTLKDDEGHLISSSEPNGPIDYIHGTGTLLPVLERSLEGKKIGESVQVTISPEDGYGERKDELVHVVPREQFDANDKIEPGMQFQAETPSGIINLTVVDVDDKNITVDANHPLAGITLNFDVSIVECREATKEEIKSATKQQGGSCSSGSCGGGCSC